jgi:predicted Zn-dependent peptidase
LVKKTTLRNGIRIISEEMPEVNSANLGIWVKTGSRNEQLSENGVSHFVEHLLFKGTPTYSAKDISEVLEELGGEINAFTTKEYTCYYIRVLYEFFFQALKVLLDMFFNSLYTEEDINREKGVIAEEIRSVEDAPDEIVHDYFAQAFFGDQPLGRPILGTIDTIMDFDRDLIIDYLKRQYIAQNIVITACGRIKHEEVLDKLTPLLERVPRGQVFRQKPPEIKPSTIIVPKAGEQVQICLGTPGVSHTDPSLFPLVVLNNILGGGLSSRLFQEIREDRGLVYSIYSYSASYDDAGLWCIHAGTSSDHVFEVLDRCIKIISDVKINNVTLRELNRSKQQIRGELLLSMESATNHMTRMGRSELNYKRVLTVEEIVERIMEVKMEEVNDLAQRLFTPENIGLAVVGPFTGEFSLNSIDSMAGLA